MTQVEPYVTVQVPVDKIVVHTRRRLLVSEQVDLLAKSIQDIGLLNPISLTENWTLIAGCHRLRACKQLGWTVIPATICSLSDVDAELAEIDENLMRADLTVLERGQHLSRRKELYEAKNPGTKQGAQGGGKGGKGTRRKTENEKISFSVDTAAKMGVTPRTIQMATRIAEKIDAEVQEIIADLPIADNQSELTKLAKMKPDQQKEVAARLATGQVETVAEVVREDRAAAQRAKVSTPLPIDKFDLIYADPPWQYDFVEAENRAIENQYPTLAVQQLCELAVPSADNALLLLWATAPKLKEALQVMESWGFSYKTHAIWDKEIIGMGYWFRGQHELLLVGVKGHFSPPPTGIRVSSIFKEKRTRHSHKPIAFYEWVERSFPSAKYIELFARDTRKGWSFWGNEIPKGQ